MLEYRCVLILLSATDGFVDNHRGTESFLPTVWAHLAAVAECALFALKEELL